jgi:hypothetical protein
MAIAPKPLQKKIAAQVSVNKALGKYKGNYRGLGTARPRATSSEISIQVACQPPIYENFRSAANPNAGGGG